uniref:Poly [ADP-ribose] polymerase n=1 Tax=Paramormyrops kingsleyae TaxID=1676925 RepID=A0A3B3RJJ2_9TELE
MAYRAFTGVANGGGGSYLDCPSSWPGTSLTPVSRVLVGSMLVMLKKGDITQEKVDAIVNSTNSTLNLQTGVSGAILKAAGKSVTDECAKLGTQKEDGVVVTSGGSLSCKHIIQMVGPSTTAGITASIEKVLQLCENKTCAKVSIPAIGTGKGNIGPKESLQAILKGLENHSSKTASTCIRFVYIVALEDRVFQCLYEYFVEKTHPSLPKKQVFVLICLILNTSDPPYEEDLAMQTFACRFILEDVSISHVSGVSGAILKAAGQSVEDECKKLSESALYGMEVAVTGGGALQCDFIIHMLGPHSCAAVTSRVERVLEECENNQITTVSFPAVGTGQHVPLQYTPPTWTKMAGKNYIVVPLVATSQEYQNISKDFIASCQHFTKTETKLQHDVLWQSYSVRKQAIDKKYPKNPNEQMLYHGTTKEICQKINAYGFNRSFCGRNATKYGLGTYFAKEAYYSCYDSYSSPDDQGQKYIYRARVLTGKPCLGESGLKEPKALNPNDPQAGLHDCAVDKLQNPFIFVVFCDSGAYPEYLITFKAV